MANSARGSEGGSQRPPRMNRPRERLNSVLDQSGISARMCVAIAPPSRASIRTAPRPAVCGKMWSTVQARSIRPILGAWPGGQPGAAAGASRKSTNAADRARPVQIVLIRVGFDS